MALAAAERAQIRHSVLESIEGPLKLEYYHQSPRRVVVAGTRRSGRPARWPRSYYEEIAELSDHISLTVYEHEDSSRSRTERQDIIEVPCVLIRGELNRPDALLWRAEWTLCSWR